MVFNEIFQKLELIEKLLKQQNLIQKEVLTLPDAAGYLDISESQLYKLTSTSAIPHYKPGGKKLYFRRTELDAWIIENRHATHAEICQKAEDYVQNISKKQCS